MSAPVPTTPVILPSQGVARVKSVMSGDTVVLLGKPAVPTQAPPEVIFTFESLSAPR
jgi:staphylococcal nuclease domain-containing protein 1